MKLNRGDIVIANLESVSKGSIQKYTRPYIIISNNKANQYSPVVTAVAMSTKTWMKLNRGDIVIANLESVSKGSIQKYTRPYIIISNNKANQYSPVVTAVAMSTKTWKKKYLPTHCLIPAAKVKVTDTDFEVFDSMALCEQIVSIDVNVQIERVVASISDTELLDKITECVKIQIGAYEKYN